MKGRTVYIISIVVFIVLVITAELTMPKPFRWVPTFSTVDKQPFGSYVFDSLLRQAMPGRYHVKYMNWHEIKTDSMARRSNILITEDSYYDATDNLYELVDSGMNVCIAASNIDFEILDTLSLTREWLEVTSIYLRSRLTGTQIPDTIDWPSDGTFAPRHFLIRDGIATSFIEEPDSVTTHNTFHAFIRKKSLNIPCVASCPFGRGRFILCTTPLLFTNYGMLDGDNAQFVLRVLSLMDTRRDFIRITSSVPRLNEEGEVRPDTPLQYFVMNAPLRWAIYLALGLVVLFMILHIRRRQRAIPVYRDPENRQLEFAQLIGTLYHQKGDHADLLRKKYNYFAEHLRRELLIDIDNEADDRENFQRIAAQTGLAERDIAGYISSIRQLVKEEEPMVSDTMLHMYFEKMDEIIRETH